MKDELIRLSKIMSERGMCSRREADRYIEAGQIVVDAEVEKEYLVRVEGESTEKGIRQLCFGLSLDGKLLKKAHVDILQPNLLRFILIEGKKRQIRRMCELVGLRVVGLKRVRIGGVRLGDLPLGKWRFLRKDEVF